jgi:hypothetical protein
MTPYLAWIVDFVGRHPHYAVTAIFLLAFSEAVPVVGTVVPGSTLDVLAAKLGPEYNKMMDGMDQVDSNSNEGKELVSVLSGLDKLCSK